MTEQTWRRRFFWAGWISAAALVLVAAGIWVYASNLRQRLNDVQLRLVDAVVKMEAANADASSVRTELDSLRSNLTLVTAADVVELSLAGQSGAPEASGRAFVSRSRGLLFAASRLPVTLDDRAFHLWYLTSSGAVSAGIVEAQPSGDIVTVLSVPQNLPTLTGFAVSKERGGTDSEPTLRFIMTSR